MHGIRYTNGSIKGILKVRFYTEQEAEGYCFKKSGQYRHVELSVVKVPPTDEKNETVVLCKTPLEKMMNHETPNRDPVEWAEEKSYGEVFEEADDD